MPRLPHRLGRRLYWKLHLAFLSVVAVSALCIGVARHHLSPPEPVPDPVRPLAALLVHGLDPNALDASLDATAANMHLRLALWGPDGAPLAASHPELRPPDLRGGESQWQGFRHGPTAVVRLEDGRWLSLGYGWRWDPRKLALAIVAGALSSALLLYPLARGFTRRIERLQGTVDRWGRGDLAARADVHGDDEVSALGRGFNQAAERVETLLASQRRMLASASHELRSPLARVRMTLELMEDGTPEGERRREAAARDIEELDGLVGDLLLASRLQGAPPARQDNPVDLGAIVAAEAERTGARASGAGVVSGDERLLRRAVRNLLENALRHGKGAEVEASVQVGPEDVDVVVLDRGPGVPASERERIFEAFYRPDGHAEGRDGGVGLGLALVADIARHHRGRVWMEPREGGGSRFTLRLPRVQGQ